MIENEICSICYDDINELAYKTPCNHKYHINCLDEYEKISKVTIKCPICRGEL